MQLHIFIFISLQWIFTSKFKLLFEVLMQIFQIFSIYFCTAKMQNLLTVLRNSIFHTSLWSLATLAVLYMVLNASSFYDSVYSLPTFFQITGSDPAKFYSCKYCARPVLSIYLNIVMCENFSHRTFFCFIDTGHCYTKQKKSSSNSFKLYFWKEGKKKVYFTWVSTPCSSNLLAWFSTSRRALAIKSRSFSITSIPDRSIPWER